MHSFTDEARLPGARTGHRHLVEPNPSEGSLLTNTIYINGPLTLFWRCVLGPAAIWRIAVLVAQAKVPIAE